MTSLRLTILWFCVIYAYTVLCQLSCDPSWTYFCDDGTCIPKARHCNLKNDCRSGEDELQCGEVLPCKSRSPDEASYNGYQCSRPCRNQRGCSQNENCVCDDECGRSCVQRNRRCQRPPAVKFSIGHSVIRFRGRNRILVRTTTYRVGDMVQYRCKRGLRLTGPLPRCGSNGKWTSGKAQCVDFSKCGQAGSVRLKNSALAPIVYGDDATENAWPWQALISQRKRTFSQTFSSCSTLGGGSLINKMWVLTAAHIFNSIAGSRTVASGQLSRIIVSLGVIQRPRSSDLPRIMRSYVAEDVVIHNLFKAATFENDIALIKLGNRIEPRTMEEIPRTNEGVLFGHYIRPVCLPCFESCFDRKSKRTPSGQALFRPRMSEAVKCAKEGNILLKGQVKIVVTGFGHTKPVQSSYSGCPSSPRRLQQGKLAVLPTFKCKRAVSLVNRRHRFQPPMVFNDKFICAVGKNPNKSVDACQGDSGGPVVRKVADRASEESCWVQIGIVSWGIGCGTGDPAYYTRVSSFSGWIKNVLERRNNCPKSSMRATASRLGAGMGSVGRRLPVSKCQGVNGGTRPDQRKSRPLAGARRPVRRKS